MNVHGTVWLSLNNGGSEDFPSFSSQCFLVQIKSLDRKESKHFDFGELWLILNLIDYLAIF